MTRQIIINFHGVGDPSDYIDADERPYWVPVAMFEEIVARTAGRKDIDVTFDDGNRSDLEIAAPMLQRFRRTAAFFVLTGRLDDAAYLSPADVLALKDMGMEVGLHGRDHVDWRKTDARQFAEETVEARRVLSEIVGQDVAAVSIPFGAYNRSVIQRLDAAGFTTILTTDGGYADPAAKIRNRTSVRGDMSRSEIDDLLAGRFAAGESLRRSASTFLRRHLI